MNLLHHSSVVQKRNSLHLSTSTLLPNSTLPSFFVHKHIYLRSFFYVNVIILRKYISTTSSSASYIYHAGTFFMIYRGSRYGISGSKLGFQLESQFKLIGSGKFYFNEHSILGLLLVYIEQFRYLPT